MEQWQHRYDRAWLELEYILMDIEMHIISFGTFDQYLWQRDSRLLSAKCSLFRSGMNVILLLDLRDLVGSSLIKMELMLSGARSFRTLYVMLQQCFWRDTSNQSLFMIACSDCDGLYRSTLSTALSAIFCALVAVSLIAYDCRQIWYHYIWHVDWWDWYIVRAPSLNW